MKLVIFDCDGVLVDSEPIACAAEADALSEIGYVTSREDIVERFAGMPSEAMYTIIEGEMGCKLPPGFDLLVKERIMKKYRTELKAIDGAADVLLSMKTRKCVASSSSPGKLALGLIETGLYESVYPHIFSTSLVDRGKPHPDLFEYSARVMGIDASECLVVEDSVAGVTAARSAGMRSIGYYGGSHCGPGHPNRLIEAGAARVIDDIRLVLQEVE